MNDLIKGQKEYWQSNLSIPFKKKKKNMKVGIHDWIGKEIVFSGIMNLNNQKHKAIITLAPLDPTNTK